MRTVLIADDELLARLGIKSLLDWEALGYHIVYEAEDGQSAFNFAKSSPPDIIITDIKMPVMDGIALIQNIKRAKIPSKIIVMSAYDDFQYVKIAMRDGADDYLLKLELESHTLKESLDRVSRQIETDQPLNVSSPPAISIAEELPNLIAGCFHSDFSDYQENQIDPTFPFRLLKIKFASPKVIEETPSETLCTAICDMLQKAANNFGAGFAAHDRNLTFYLLIQFVSEYQATDQNMLLARIGKNIQEMALMLFNFSCYIGVGEEIPKLKDVFLHRQSTEEALRQACFSKSRFALNGCPDTEKDIDLIDFFQKDLAKLEIQLSRGNSTEIQHLFDTLLRELRTFPYINRQSINGLCHTLIFLCVSNLSSPVPEKASQFFSGLTLEEYTTRSEYLDWIEQLKSTILQIINPESENQRIILLAKQCIRQNYNKDISLNFVAEYLNLSPNYFSKLFKKHTGLGFIDYLTNLRIEKSIELLHTGKYKVYEVADKVGFENATYFSQIFKKRTGKSPYQVKNYLSAAK